MEEPAHQKAKVGNFSWLEACGKLGVLVVGEVDLQERKMG
jgi:hypothetical protein